MATTTNFGWETPDDTDLVKDGAAAIRTALGGVDTSFVDLKGGTTGQVLSKASNTDLDFSWVAQDDSNAIQNALLTTTGDTIYASGASTPARLGIGTTGQVLTVSGGVPTWATPAGGGGKVLQVVQGTYSTTTTISTTTFTDTGLSLAITPTSSTSKILVMINQQMEIERSSTELGSGVRLLRGSTTVFDQASGVFFGSQGIGVAGVSSVALNAICGFNYLDSPATTSSTTYKVQARPSTTANSGLIRAQGSGSTSVITLLEIGA